MKRHDEQAARMQAALTGNQSSMESFSFVTLAGCRSRSKPAACRPFKH